MSSAFQQVVPRNAIGPVPEPVQFLHAPTCPIPEYLKEWLRLPRLPVLSDDLPLILDPQI